MPFFPGSPKEIFMAEPTLSQLRDKARKAGFEREADQLWLAKDIEGLKALLEKREQDEARWARYTELVGEKPWAWPMDDILGLTQRQFEEACAALDWENHNSHNVLFQSKRTGAARLIKEAQRILDAHLAGGGISPELLDDRRRLKDAINELPIYEKAVELAMAGKLAPYSLAWEIATWDGWTVAHEAATVGMIPEGFDRWDLKDGRGTAVAFTAAGERELPEWFKEWEIREGIGWSVAHHAAANNCLPAGFDRWDIADYRGWTVAHEFAQANDEMPEGFDQWELQDVNGLSVAHIFACNPDCEFPEDFDKYWGLRNNQGITVAEYVLTERDLPANFDQWELVPEDKRPTGWNKKQDLKVGM
jgi:hypothetical protein